jgi:hypothetical protein
MVAEVVDLSNGNFFKNSKKKFPGKDKIHIKYPDAMQHCLAFIFKIPT